jgi:hypothetical protein
VSIAQAQMLQKELAERNNPEVLPPLRLVSGPETNFVAKDPGARFTDGCTMGRCFDLTRWANDGSPSCFSVDYNFSLFSFF